MNKDQNQLYIHNEMNVRDEILSECQKNGGRSLEENPSEQRGQEVVFCLHSDSF